MAITGGPHTFGAAAESGRVFLLLLHLAMVPLLYRLARKLGCDVWAAALGAFLFSVSPLAIFYQRLALLDSIMLFWLLVSLNLLFDGWGRLSRFALSGICFGLALTSKEAAVFQMPAVLLIVVQRRRWYQGRFAVGAWLFPMLAVMSWYPLYAALKGELLPAGSAQFFGSGYAGSKVSLLDSLMWQAARSGGGLLNFDNQFWQLVRGNWLLRDPVLLAGGALATALNLARAARGRNGRLLATGLLGTLPFVYLGRGGIVFDHYILSGIPFLCLNLAVLLSPLFARLSGRAGGAMAILAGFLLIRGYWEAGTLLPLYLDHPSTPGRQAIAWIKQNLPAESPIIARDFFWTDLREPGLGGPAFPNVHSHWKVAADPEIRDGVFRNDWRTVDYLIVSRDLERDFAASNNTLAIDALRNAHLIKEWTAEPVRDSLHPPEFIQLWKVNKAGVTEAALLRDSASYITNRFERDGAYVDSEGQVTSEAQAYAMLRAVWSGDQAAFNRAWEWTQRHLMDADGLLAWLWRDGVIQDAHTASDADTDAALALLLAGKRWDSPDLVEAGRRMVRAIWQREVVTVNGQPHLVAGDWAARERGRVLALNPSYFSPVAYRVFKEVDPDHDWWEVLNTGYRTLFAASEASLGASKSAGLPPDWVGLDRVSGELVRFYHPRFADTTRYASDAARTYWRVALDRRWTGDGRADAYLRLAGFLRDEVSRKGRVSAVYGRDGTVVEEAPSLVGIAGALAALLRLEPTSGHLLHARYIVAGATRTSTGLYWGDPDDLYSQEWGWFATALYADAVPNLWDDRWREAVLSRS
jgi:endo-1,4-beta-D-glucanase Y